MIHHHAIFHAWLADLCLTCRLPLIRNRECEIEIGREDKIIARSSGGFYINCQQSNHTRTEGHFCERDMPEQQFDVFDYYTA
jgi:hypothetical protein